MWDCSNENGEIASAVLVPSTKTVHFAHGAMALTRRSNFVPKAMYSDTWPNKSAFWSLLFDKIQGRLGLFHCIQRMSRTLKKNHVDHCRALNGMLNCIHHHHEEDHENLLKALKTGTLSGKHSDDEISQLKATKVFKERCDKCLRKQIRSPNVMCDMLDDWFDQHKCSSSNMLRPARGRRCPISGDTLFTADTKTTVEECKKRRRVSKTLFHWIKCMMQHSPAPIPLTS